MYEELRGITKVWLYEVFDDLVKFATAKSKPDVQPFRVRVAHVVAALQRAPGNNANIYNSTYIFTVYCAPCVTKPCTPDF